MYQRILVALGEEAQINDSLIDRAAVLVRATHGALNLLHVLFPPSSGFPDPLYLTADGMHSTVTIESFQGYLEEWRSQQNANQKALDAQTEALLTQGIQSEWTQAVGNPGQQICKIARDWQADLIVMGRHGRSGVQALFLGSVSNYVLHHAPCSVMVVQGKGAPAQP